MEVHFDWPDAAAPAALPDSTVPEAAEPGAGLDPSRRIRLRVSDHRQLAELRTELDALRAELADLRAEVAALCPGQRTD